MFYKYLKKFKQSEPFLAITLDLLTKVENQEIPTMAVFIVSTVREEIGLMYNPAFISDLSYEEFAEVLKHELLHIFFCHLEMHFDDYQRGNIACDLEVNNYIDIAKIARLNPVTIDSYHLPAKMGTQWYYDNLPDDVQEMSPEFDNHKEWNNTPSATGDKVEEQKVCKGTIARTIQNAIGSEVPIPEYAEWQISTSSPAPELAHGWNNGDGTHYTREIEKGDDNTDALKSFWHLLNIIRQASASWLKKPSKIRPRRRPTDTSGKRHIKNKVKILIGIDTSSSVNNKLLCLFWRYIQLIPTNIQIHILECDTEIVKEYDWHIRQAPAEIHGGGGTNFQPVIDYFNEHKNIYNVLLYFTDGVGPLPTKIPHNTYWIIYNESESIYKMFKENGQKVINI